MCQEMKKKNEISSTLAEMRNGKWEMEKMQNEWK